VNHLAGLAGQHHPGRHRHHPRAPLHQRLRLDNIGVPQRGPECSEVSMPSSWGGNPDGLILSARPILRHDLFARKRSAVGTGRHTIAGHTILDDATIPVWTPWATICASGHLVTSQRAQHNSIVPSGAVAPNTFGRGYGRLRNPLVVTTYPSGAARAREYGGKHRIGPQWQLHKHRPPVALRPYHVDLAFARDRQIGTV